LHVCRFAHEGILNCARAIRDDLRSLGLLEQLLLGSDPTQQQQQQQQQHDISSSGSGKKGMGVSTVFPSSDGSVGAAAEAAGDAAATNGGAAVQYAAASTAAGKGPAAAAQAAKERPDCRGWTLVLTGHSLGKYQATEGGFVQCCSLWWWCCAITLCLVSCVHATGATIRCSCAASRRSCAKVAMGGTCDHV
jgi:hypothetical protein